MSVWKSWMNYYSASCFIREQAVKERCVACPPMPAPFFTTTDESVSCVFLVSSTSTRHICQFFGGHPPLSKVVLCQWPTIWTVLELGTVGISKCLKQKFLWKQMPLFHKRQSGKLARKACYHVAAQPYACLHATALSVSDCCHAVCAFGENTCCSRSVFITCGSANCWEPWPNSQIIYSLFQCSWNPKKGVQVWGKMDDWKDEN